MSGRTFSTPAVRGAVDKIICLGKNYLEHAKELGDAIPDKPVKAFTALGYELTGLKLRSRKADQRKDCLWRVRSKKLLKDMLPGGVLTSLGPSASQIAGTSLGLLGLS